MEVLYAHSPNEWGDWHGLQEHLEGTGDLAAGFADAFKAGEAGRFVGRVHDSGKAAGEWQSKLRVVAGTGERVNIDHKSLGCKLAWSRLSIVGALVVHGHHGGLAQADSLPRWWEGLDQRSQGARLRSAATQALAEVMPDLFEADAGSLLPQWLDQRDPLQVEFFTRMLFSTLVDADILDTRAHHLGLDRPEVAEAWNPAEAFDRFSARRTASLSGTPGSADDLTNKARHEVYQACLDAAEGEPGIYRLSAPTGAGKTHAAMAFALRHAAKHGHRRVVVAVPFTTITEQNADVYRRLLDDEEPVVLEHHSQAISDDTPHREWARLASENWDVPVVVTTTVQLFESMFGRNTRQLRKLHRLSKAVIVLDEVQALPHQLLPVICDGLRRLTTDYGTTVVLASATQPEVQETTALRDIAVREIVPEPARIYETLRRVRYDWWLEPKPTLSEVAAVAASEHSALVVVNTVKDARRMYEVMASAAAENVLVSHLSTAMCPEHRRTVLAEVKSALAAGNRVLLASTQLVEAGVDIDFPVVYRGLAPADSLQQAAGRANREGRLGPEGGRCVVFDPADGGAPPSYATAIGISRSIFGPSRGRPDDPVWLAEYYRNLYQALQIEGVRSRAQEITDARKQLDFESVAARFRMIEDDTLPVVVPYGDQVILDQVQEWLHTLRAAKARNTLPDRDILRKLQAYTVALRRRTRERGDVDARCHSVIGDLAEWQGGYDENVGIHLEIRDEDFQV